MARSLQEFLNATNANTIRANNQFEVEVYTGYPDLDAALHTGIMFGQGITLPNRTLEFAPVSYKGAEFTNLVPTTMKWESDHTMTIISDVNGSWRRAFLAWQAKVINPDIEAGSVFEGDRRMNPQSNLRVTLFDWDNKTVASIYKFFNIKIQSVGGLTLTYEGGDKATFEVIFKSTYWMIEYAAKGHAIYQR